MFEYEQAIHEHQSDSFNERDIQVHLPQILIPRARRFIELQMPTAIAEMTLALQGLDFSLYTQNCERRFLSEAEFAKITNNLLYLKEGRNKYFNDNTQVHCFEESFQARLQPFIGSLFEHLRKGQASSEAFKAVRLRSSEMSCSSAMLEAEMGQARMESFQQPWDHLVSHLKSLLNIHNNETIRVATEDQQQQLRFSTQKERDAIDFLDEMMGWIYGTKKNSLPGRKPMEFPFPKEQLSQYLRKN
ncbi:hypothetical protein [Simkania sp.]|uniref:hypothetical protein n=1 Tax=Simkania sp. TaxID=34094 RepID=UPI003B52BAA6